MKNRVATLVVAVVLAGCQTLQVSDIGRDDRWPTSEREAGATNGTTAALSLPLEEAWVYNANAAFGPGQPIVMDRFVIVANRKGEVHAINRESGKKIGVERLGDAINGTPVLATGGVLIVPLDYGSKRMLNAWDLRKGSSSWKVKGDSRISTSVADLDDGVVVVDRASVVRFLSRADGSEQWSIRLDQQYPIEASPVVISGDALIASTSGAVRRLSSADGHVVWAADIGEPIYMTPAVVEGRVVVTGTRGGIFVLDSDSGATIWTTNRPDAVKLSSPAVEGDIIAVGGTDGLVVTLDRSTGAVGWTTHVGAPVVAAPLITRNHVFVGTMDSRVLALERRSGDIVWEEKLRGRVKSALAADDGDLFVICEPRFVYRFTNAVSQQAVAEKR